jgi:hypothetical protein
MITTKRIFNAIFTEIFKNFRNTNSFDLSSPLKTRKGMRQPRGSLAIMKKRQWEITWI